MFPALTKLNGGGATPTAASLANVLQDREVTARLGVERDHGVDGPQHSSDSSAY